METKHYRRNLRDMGPVKRLALHLLNQGAAPAEIASEMGVSRTTVWNWAAAREPEPAWARKLPPARLPALPAADLARLRDRLRGSARNYGFPTDAWTMARAAVMIESECGLVCSAVQAFHLLRL